MWFLWFRVSALAFFGAIAVAAEVCGGLPALPPAGSNVLDDAADPMSFRLSVKPGGPAFRITVRSLLRGQSDAPVHAGDIEVTRCSDGRQVQLLAIMASQPIHFARTFRADDVNFDGYLDLSVQQEFGATWERRLWWIYDPASGRFLQNELTRALGQSGHNRYQFDSTKHVIQTENLMAGCPPLVARYRVENNHLIKVHEEIGRQSIDAGPGRPGLPAGIPCTVTVSDLVDETMRVTQVRRFVEGKPVVN